MFTIARAEEDDPTAPTEGDDPPSPPPLRRGPAQSQAGCRLLG